MTLIPSGPVDARMMIVADCVSYRDLQSNTILNDREFDRMLYEAGIVRSQCFVTALIRGQIQGQNFDSQVAQSQKARTPDHVPLHHKYVKKELISYVKALEKDIELVKPRVILALGNGVLFTLTGKWGIKSWRSSIIDYETAGGHKCLIIPAYPPSFIQALWKERNTTIFDYKKCWSIGISDSPHRRTEYNFIIEPDFGSASRCLVQHLRRVENGPTKLSVDIETRGGHIACIGIGWSSLDAICIPLMRANFDVAKINYWMLEEEAYLMHLMYKLLSHPNCQVIGQNFIYDAQYFYRHLHYVPNFKRDTMLAQHSMFSSMPKGLDVLSGLYCEDHVYWKDESKNWDAKLGERQLWSYNCVDCVRTYEIDTGQQAAIDNFPDWPKLPEIHDFQQSLFWPVLESMNIGLRVNNESKARLSAELAAAIDLRNNWITELIGFPLNIKSPKQMTDLFYRVFAQKPILSRATHNPTCDDAALERIASREPLLSSLCGTIRELRSLGVFRSTFLEAPVDVDERMRCSFNIAGTETYRFSSSENAFGSGMNLQNVPKGDENEGLPNIRKLFIADEGMEFFDIDLDSADARIVAKESGCVKIQAWFDAGLKPYVEVAKEYYQDDSITKEHDAYKAFKVICHGTNYGGGAGEISNRMPKSAKVGGLGEEGISRIQSWYLQDMFPEIAEWHKEVEAQVRSNRFVENVFGYRVYYFDRLEGNIFKEAIAAIPQSTVACLINRGYRNIYENERGIKVLLQVHDSLAGQYPSVDRDYSRRQIIKHCTIPLPYPEPITIPVDVATSPVSWGDCK